MKNLILIITCVLSSSVLAQQGGSHTFSFLNLEGSARIAGTGGSMSSVHDGDVAIAFANPSLMDSSMHGALALNYINYFAGVNYLFAGYAHRIGDYMVGGNLMYLNYGKFHRTDEFGNILGEFTGNDMVLSLSAAKEVEENFTLGTNFKIINSVMDIYSSFGLALDFSGNYHNVEKGFSASAIIRNVGMQLSTYTSDNREPLPFGIDIGFSKKAAKAPFRIHVLLKDLQKWDLTYEDPNAEPEVDFNGDPIEVKPPGFLEKAMRHVNLGVEMVPSEAFFLSMGFNYRRRQELKYENRPGLVGFSVGAGIKIKRFRFSYALSSYHRAAGSNHISISTNILSPRAKK